MKKQIGILCILLMTTSCRVAYRVILGVDSSPKWLTNSDLDKEFNKKNIHPEMRFILDTSSYIQSVKNDLKLVTRRYLKEHPIDSSSLNLRYTVAKNDIQPAQVRYFNKNGKQIFKLVNCFIDKPIRMDWNIGNCFSAFPPVSQNVLMTESYHNIDFFLPHIKTLNGSQINLSSIDNYEYYAIVFWNGYLKRASKKLIEQIQEYHKQFTDKKVFVFYVNNHNQFIWQNASIEEKGSIMNYTAKNK
jgi:hypothetical protein